MIKKVIRKFSSKSLLRFLKKQENCKLSYCTEIKAKKRGPTVLVSGSIHGDEHVGAKFIKYFIQKTKSGEITLKKGRVLLLLANPLAFEKDSRFLDINMNRAFIKNKDLTLPEYKRAQKIEDFFRKKKIDYVIDLHSVSADDSKMLVMRYSLLEKLHFWLEKTKLDTVFAYHKGGLPGTIIDYFLDTHGAPAVTIECGNHFKRSAIEIAKHEVFLLLSELGMIDKEYRRRRRPPKIFEKIGTVKVGKNFKWLVEPKTGTKIKKGEIFAIDEKNGKQKAKEDLVLFMPTAQKRVKHDDHDAGFLCKEIDLNQ